MEEIARQSGLHVRQASGKLAGFVSHYWLGLDNRDADYDIVPDGCIDVVLHVRDGATRLWAYGTTTQVRREPIEPGDYLGIRFRPGMARHFLSASAGDLTDSRQALDREFSIDAHSLAGNLDSAGIFGRIDGMLEERLAKCQPQRSAIDAAVREIAASNGGIRVEALARSYGRSRRQFERAFLGSVGITPKQYCVIVRFRHAAAQLSSPAAGSLAAIAADAGYADQSHMVRDFRRLAGASPSGWDCDVAFVQDS